MASKEKHNARWDRCTTKKLLEICVKEIHISGKPGVSFKARRWEVVVDEFNKRANKNYNQKQLKNRLDNLKLDWTTWKQLLGKETDWDGTMRQNYCSDDTWWEAKIKDNSKYARFRYQGLEFHEELEIIFGETVATSQRSWTPATGAPSEDSSIKTNPTIPEEIDEYDEEETNLDEDASHMQGNRFNYSDGWNWVRETLNTPVKVTRMFRMEPNVVLELENILVSKVQRHDARILSSVLEEMKSVFPHPPEGKYYVVDLDILT
ncbi:hypothetical protein K1719_035987 [Acacia pycnantha]|nr:hypothetical protein K1719_035987 [Acacia pycnantha]